jgi:hypothetical protein
VVIAGNDLCAQLSPENVLIEESFLVDVSTLSFSFIRESLVRGMEIKFGPEYFCPICGLTTPQGFLLLRPILLLRIIFHYFPLLSISPYYSLLLPISPYFSLLLPITPYYSLLLPITPYYSLLLSRST